MSAYTQKFLDPRWQRKRLEILSRDQFCCQRCFDTESTLHVHHKFYRAGADPWDYPDEALVTLCEGCHENEGHFGKSADRELLEALKTRGALAAEIQGLASALADEAKVPLDEHDWSVLTWTIRTALWSREESGGGWASLVDAYAAHLRRQSDEAKARHAA